MSDIPTRPAATAQSIRGLRVSDIRRSNILDPEVVISDTYAAADIPLVGAAVWTQGLNVRGYDRIHFLTDLTVGGVNPGHMTALVLDVQAGFNQRSTADTDWYDRYSSFDLRFGGANALTAGTPITLDTSTMAGGTVVRLAFDLETVGHYMRFRVSAVGSNLTNSRVTIKAIRDLS